MGSTPACLCLALFMPICLSVRLSVCLSVYLPVCCFVCYSCTYLCPCRDWYLLYSYVWVDQHEAIELTSPVCCRSMQVAKDLDSLAKVSNIANRSIEVTPTQQARACCEYMASLRDVAQEEPDEQFRHEAALRFEHCNKATVLCPGTAPAPALPSAPALPLPQHCPLPQHYS